MVNRRPKTKRKTNQRKPKRPLPPGAILCGYDDLRSRFGIGYTRVHIGRLIAASKFPRPIWLGENRRAFVAAEIEAWLAQKMRERGTSQAAK